MSTFPPYMKHADDYRDMLKPDKKPIDSVYLAGPDVFLLNAIEHGKKLSAICAEYGIAGRYPMDNEIKGAFASQRAMGDEITWANYGMLFESDAIVANMNHFRGLEPDSGTCAEVGFAVALRKPVFLYMEDLRSVLDKVPHQKNDQGLPVDQWNNVVEDFDYPANLMMVSPAVVICSTFEEAIQAAAKYGRDADTGVTDAE
jgi:nucleoside 2-deoxyribosyltransferase